MDVLSVLGVCSLASTVVGLYLLGEKKSSGFIIFTISLLCQMYVFYVQGNWFLLFQMVALIIFNIVNYIKWEKNTDGQ